MSKTNKDFKIFLIRNDISYAKLSDVTGLKVTSLRNQLTRTKPCPTWAVTYMAGYELGLGSKPSIQFTPDAKNECGCYVGKDNLFRKMPGCKIIKSQHKFK